MGLMPMFGPAEQLGVEPGECRYCGDVIGHADGADLDEGVCSWECRAYLAEYHRDRLERQLLALRKVAIEAADEIHAAEAKIMTLLRDVTPETREIAHTCGVILYWTRELRRQAGEMETPHAGEA
ncbi:MAG: hypothetical protein IMW98_08560 [Firmicutes bacterium]|nr:hypothetical protein [Bacillota bacterium]MBE3590857.1 hypothetical protein [Bacillota bacterium]